jgi:hypothetical protein
VAAFGGSAVDSSSSHKVMTHDQMKAHKKQLIIGMYLVAKNIQLIVKTFERKKKRTPPHFDDNAVIMQSMLVS